MLRAYGKLTGDYALQERVDVQTGIKLILNLCLADGFDMFPSLLVTDGSCMIDRRMGIHGHPLEIQVSYFHTLSFWRLLVGNWTWAIYVVTAFLFPRQWNIHEHIVSVVCHVLVVCFF